MVTQAIRGGIFAFLRACVRACVRACMVVSGAIRQRSELAIQGKTLQLPVKQSNTKVWLFKTHLNNQITIRSVQPGLGHMIFTIDCSWKN